MCVPSIPHAFSIRPSHVSPYHLVQLLMCSVIQLTSSSLTPAISRTVSQSKSFSMYICVPGQTHGARNQRDQGHGAAHLYEIHISDGSPPPPKSFISYSTHMNFS